MTKLCAKCKKEKLIDEFYSTGSYCKPCAKEYASNRRKDPEFSKKKNEYGVEWNKNNKDLKRVLDKEWVENNREKKREINRRYSRKNKNNGGHRSRAKRFGVKFVNFKKHDIFERDNWLCGLCGEPVDKTTPWPEPYCATLDHIIPMSKGGDHTPQNSQCSHFICNLTKRDSCGEDVFSEM